MTGEGAPSPTAIERDIHDEAERLSKMAVSSGLDLRLMGGLAIWLTLLMAADCGLCHTAEGNLRRVVELASVRPPAEAPYDPARQAETLLARVDAAPKRSPGACGRA